jgi:hypothetical protein
MKRKESFAFSPHKKVNPDSYVYKSPRQIVTKSVEDVALHLQRLPLYTNKMFILPLYATSLKALLHFVKNQHISEYRKKAIRLQNIIPTEVSTFEQKLK